MEKNVSLENVAARFAAHRPRPILRLRHFAILALLTEIDGELHFILNKRAKGIHQPGGKAQPDGGGRGFYRPALLFSGNRAGKPPDDMESR